MEIAVFAALAKGFDWGENRPEVKHHGIEAVVRVDHTTTMKLLLGAIMAELPQGIAERFAVDGMLHGYSTIHFKQTIILFHSEQYI